MTKVTKQNMERPKLLLKSSRRGELFPFDLGFKDVDAFLDASRSRACLTFDEFCLDHQLKRIRPRFFTANDYLTLGLNSANAGLRYLPHKRDEIEDIRKKISLLTYSKDSEKICALIKNLEDIGVRVFWPEVEPEKDMKELYQTYLENVRFQEYTNRRNLRIFNSATSEEKELM